MDVMRVHQFHSLRCRDVDIDKGNASNRHLRKGPNDASGGGSRRGNIADRDVGEGWSDGLGLVFISSFGPFGVIVDDLNGIMHISHREMVVSYVKLLRRQVYGGWR